MNVIASAFIGVFVLVFDVVFADVNVRWLFKQHTSEFETFVRSLLATLSVHGCLERYMDNAKARFYTVKDEDLPMDLLMLSEDEKEGNDPYVCVVCMFVCAYNRLLQ